MAAQNKQMSVMRAVSRGVGGNETQLMSTVVNELSEGRSWL